MTRNSPSRCPWCGSGRIRRSHPQSLLEGLARLRGERVYHCGECAGRFVLARYPVTEPEAVPAGGRSAERRDARERRRRRRRMAKTIALVVALGLAVGIALARNR